MQIEGATKLELDLRNILIWNEGFCALLDYNEATEASWRAGVLSGACEELQRLRAEVERLREENKLLHDCRNACAGFYRDWLALGRDRPKLMTNRLVFEAGERFLIGPKTGK